MTEPGGIVIEAFADADQVAAGGKPRLPRFSMVAYTGGPMKIAGWRFPVVVDLAGLSIPTQSRPIRFGHDMASGVGHTDQIRIDGGKLLAAGVVSRDTRRCEGDRRFGPERVSLGRPRSAPASRSSISSRTARRRPSTAGSFPAR